MKSSRAFIILSLVIASFLLLSPAALAAKLCCPNSIDCCCSASQCIFGGSCVDQCQGNVVCCGFPWESCYCAEFTPATAAIALAGIGGIAYLLRKRLGKAPKAH